MDVYEKTRKWSFFDQTLPTSDGLDVGCCCMLLLYGTGFLLYRLFLEQWLAFVIMFLLQECLFMHKKQ